MLTTIASFAKAEDAHLLRMRLEEGGVRAFVQDENVAQFAWAAGELGGVRVQIDEEDADRARAILDDPGA